MGIQSIFNLWSLIFTNSNNSIENLTISSNDQKIQLKNLNFYPKTGNRNTKYHFETYYTHEDGIPPKDDYGIQLTLGHKDFEISIEPIKMFTSDNLSDIDLVKGITGIGILYKTNNSIQFNLTGQWLYFISTIDNNSIYIKSSGIYEGPYILEDIEFYIIIVSIVLLSGFTIIYLGFQQKKKNKEKSRINGKLKGNITFIHFFYLYDKCFILLAEDVRI